MPLLIDGHNLIGRMPDLSLEDPEDEVALVRRLRRYCWRHRRRAIVIFDAGLPGGRSPILSSPEVQVIFAPYGRTADALLCERIRRMRDPAGLIVVSSDHSVQAAARDRGMRVIPAETFAAELAADDGVEEGAEEKPRSVEDLEEWLRLFNERREI
ncbi:MAG TPA: hypothetical protein EYP52_08520 [Anaerolineae bacterium]|nr:hypothetical protein [Anaerolineae bacterium]